MTSPQRVRLVGDARIQRRAIEAVAALQYLTRVRLAVSRRVKVAVT
jgi:hypothetical protein